MGDETDSRRKRLPVYDYFLLPFVPGLFVLVMGNDEIWMDHVVDDGCLHRRRDIHTFLVGTTRRDAQSFHSCHIGGTLIFHLLAGSHRFVVGGVDKCCIELRSSTLVLARQISTLRSCIGLHVGSSGACTSWPTSIYGATISSHPEGFTREVVATW